MIHIKHMNEGWADDPLDSPEGWARDPLDSPNYKKSLVDLKNDLEAALAINDFEECTNRIREIKQEFKIKENWGDFGPTYSEYLNLWHDKFSDIIKGQNVLRPGI